MLYGEGTLPVLLLPVLYPLQNYPLSDRNERLAIAYRLVHMSTRMCYVIGDFIGCDVDVACVDVLTSVTRSLSRYAGLR